MLTIRDSQLRELQRADSSEFESLMTAELRRYYPVLSRLHSRPQLLEIVTGGRSAAEVYGFTKRREVRLFIHLSVMLGAGFSKDPLLPWAGRILLLDQPEDWRMSHLYDRAMEYLDSTLGPRGVLPARPFHRLYDLEFASLTPGSGENVRALVRDACNSLWPEKFQLVEPGRWDRLVEIALGRARRYGVDAPEQVGYYVVLSFVCGYAFDKDPQYHWLAPVLNDPHRGGKAKMEMLSEAVRTVLTQAFAGAAGNSK